MQQHQPALVIVSIGGNDFLRRQSAATARANIHRICSEAKGSGAQVLLVAVPELSLMAAAGRLSDHPMYEEIAEDLKIPLGTVKSRLHAAVAAFAKRWKSLNADDAD